MKEEHELVEPFTFAWVVAGIATGILAEIGSQVAEPIIKNVLGKEDVDYEQLFKDSLNKIEEAVKDAIEGAFITQYISDCNYVQDQLLTYEETKNIGILNTMQDRSSQLAHRLYGQGIKGFGGLLMACNLHLLTLRALAEKDNTYRTTLQRKFEDYASWIDEVGDAFQERIRKRISAGCTCYFYLSGTDNKTKKITDVCDEPHREDLFNWEYTYDWGAREDGFLNESDCDNHRIERYRREVTPSQLLSIDAFKMAKAYREHRIESEE